jgi:hypothetical protein
MLDELPRTANGKLDSKSPTSTRSITDPNWTPPFVAPRTSAEELLASVGLMF